MQPLFHRGPGFFNKEALINSEVAASWGWWGEHYAQVIWTIAKRHIA